MKIEVKTSESRKPVAYVHSGGVLILRAGHVYNSDGFVRRVVCLTLSNLVVPEAFGSLETVMKDDDYKGTVLYEGDEITIKF